MNVNNANAKVIHYGAFYEEDYNKYNDATVTYIKVTKDKIILKEELIEVYKNRKCLKSKKLKNKVRTFKLSKNIKFYKVKGNTMEKIE